MRTKEDVERYLINLDTPYEVLGDGIYRLNDDLPDIDDIIVMVSDPLQRPTDESSRQEHRGIL